MAYKKIEHYDDDTTEKLSVHYKSILSLLGEDPEREGLVKTPQRIARAMQFFLQGYNQDARAILESAKFHENVNEMVIVNK